MKSITKEKEYTLKNGTKYFIIYEINYSNNLYWTWKHIIPFNKKSSIVITETHSCYDYSITHLYGDNHKTYLIPGR